MNHIKYRSKTKPYSQKRKYNKYENNFSLLLGQMKCGSQQTEVAELKKEADKRD